MSLGLEELAQVLSVAVGVATELEAPYTGVSQRVRRARRARRQRTELAGDIAHLALQDELHSLVDPDPDHGLACATSDPVS